MVAIHCLDCTLSTTAADMASARNAMRAHKRTTATPLRNGRERLHRITASTIRTEGK